SFLEVEMHIPDGYLSPQTCGVLGGASAITAACATYKTAKTVKAKYIPLLSIGSAFSFLVMMFNIPIPDGTSAHAVGGALLAVILGPWAAFISVSIALVIQALFFGDGGIMALGANIFNMGFILPFSSYLVYRLIAGNSTLTAKRRWVAAGIAGFVGINLAALATAVEFGIQPMFFTAPDGTPLYSPYGLKVAISAMAFAHLLVAGPVEALVSGLVVSYLQKTNPGLLELELTGQSKSGFGKLVWGLVILAVLSPLGLLAQGTAWGEWGAAELQGKLGFVPKGVAEAGEKFTPWLFRGYGAKGWDQSFWQQAVIYIAAALAGLLLVTLLVYIIGRFLPRGDRTGGNSGMAPRE
ncbi:MAG TPA: cobalt transporter CbiM, partial [Verrucomicrobiae bacterium]|nr:cobalt transporter CbiM [Verrucomicrobiae bacterium]